jgi:predicted phage replisome organizer
MAEVKWIKLLTEMFDDEKIKLIEAVPEADMILVIWIKLLTLAGKKNMNGYIFLTENIPYTDEMLATLFNRPINTVRLALETFKNFGMINYNGEGQIKITNWEKHQNIDGMDKIREQNRIRVQRFRDKPKEILPPATPLNKERKEEDKIRLDKIREKHYSNVTLKGIEFVKIFNDYKEMRTKLKKPMTLRAEELVIKELDKLSCNVTEQIKILEQSIMNSWQGVFPLKNKDTPKKMMGIDEALKIVNGKEVK